MNLSSSQTRSWCLVAIRVVIGWHLAYTGLWALLTSGGFSWAGPLHCAHWLFGGAFRAVAVSPAMSVIDFALAVGLVAAGLLLMFGRALIAAVAFGIAVFLLQYVINPPHFGHTGVSHVMFLDRNLVEVAMLLFVAAGFRRPRAAAPAPVAESVPADAPAAEPDDAKRLDRRDLIVGLGSTLALAGAGVAGKVLRSEPIIRVTGPAVNPFDPAVDLAGLVHPMTAFGNIGDVKLSRLILGGNIIGGWAHARDMHYYDKLVKGYYTDERVFRTFRIAEASGVNTILTNPALMRVINRYWREEGGKIQFISDCGWAKGDLIAGARASVENGASLVYAHGGFADEWAIAGEWKKFREYLDTVRKFGCPTGIGCHRLATVKFCIEHDCIPDFWMKTVHRVDYPTAHIGENGKPTRDGLGACDNRFVDTDRQEVFDFMQNRPEPWIAFKILGAGIEHPKDAFPVVFKGGADFACVGMYDYQLVEDVNIANEVFEHGLPDRKRPWHG